MSQKPIVTSAIVVLLILTTAGIATVGQSFRPPPLVNSSAVARQLARSEDPSEQLRAWDFYVERCADGEGRACGKLGWMQKKREPGIDYLTHFADGCDLGDGWSCAQYAHNIRPELEHGDGDAMVDALRKGCQGKNTWSCMKLGYEYSEGVFVAKDDLLASYLFRTSCADGQPYGCLYLGSMYDDAGQVERGEAFFLEACEKELPFGCMIAGARMREKDPARSLELLHDACGDGITDACRMAAEAPVRDRDPEQSSKLLRGGSAEGEREPPPDGVVVDHDKSITDISLAVDSKGYPHIAFASARGKSVRYARWDGSAWRDEYVAAGEGVSVQLDLNDTPHLAIWNKAPYGIFGGQLAGTPHGLWYASRTPPGGWGLEKVAPIHGSGMTPDLVMVGDTPHIAYHDFDAGNLRYAVKSGSSWTDGIVVSTGNVGFSPTMAVVAGEVHIVHRDASNRRARHSQRGGEGWQTSSVLQTTDSGNYSSMTADSVGDLHLAVVGAPASGGEQIFYGRVGGPNQYVVDGDRPSLVVDSQDEPIIVYWATDWTLGMTSSKNGWNPVTLDDSPGGEVNDAVYDPVTAKVHVAYSEIGTDQLKYLTFDP